jgi:hypothetical protein
MVKLKNIKNLRKDQGLKLQIKKIRTGTQIHTTKRITLKFQMANANFKEGERKKKNIVDDNNQHTSSLEEENTARSLLTWWKEVFHY